MTKVEYKSVFRIEFQNLVEIKKALGFYYDSEAMAFKRIDAFLINNHLQEKKISQDLCNKWCQKRSYESKSNQSTRISNMRVFCRYLIDIGASAYAPPIGIVKKSPRYNAHIYTKDEIKRFFTAVDLSQSIPTECPYRGIVMPVFFRILYTSGMRVSELRLVKIKDVNIEQAYITVRNGKNHKDRIVPIHPKLAAKCASLKNSIHSASSDDEYFFMIRHGEPMPLVNVYSNFRRYLEKADIHHTGKGPRCHDFRHTYCVNLLGKWVDEEKDLLAYLPYMKTMLGHEGFEETAYYLKLTAEACINIRDSMKKAFPNIIEEVDFEEHEFY